MQTRISRIIRTIAGIAFLVLQADADAAPAAEQWPSWRGPLANGVAPQGDPPVQWSETNHVQWKTKIPGFGTATPIVWGSQVFIQTAIPTGKKVQKPVEKDEAAGAAKDPAPGAAPNLRQTFGVQTPDEAHQFVLLAIDRDSGKIQWQRVAREEVPHEGHHRDHGFASASPVTDGHRVYAYFGSRGLHCYDLQGGLKWQKDLGKMKIKNSFGEGSSPALCENTIIVNWDHEGSALLMALDKTTGRELWRQSRDETTSWSTPLVVEHEGQAQVVVDASNKVRSYDFRTGKPLWECAGLTANVIPSPVSGHGLVYAMSGFRGNSLMAIKLGKTGDLGGSEAIAWNYKKNTPYVPSPLLYDDLLYFLSNNNAILTCCDAKTGQVMIDAARLEGLTGVYASPVGAGGRVYVVGRDGNTVVLKKSAKLEVLAANKLNENFDASPAIAGKQLFLRGHEYLYCISSD